MSLDEYKFLFCWIKLQTLDLSADLKWNPSSPQTIPSIWENIDSCHSGEFFLKVLMNVSGDLVHCMLKQVKKFLNDHFCVPENLLGRINLNYADEMVKWELCELIFFISFLSRSVDCEGIFDILKSFEGSFALALKISLKILTRTVGKMKILETSFCEIKTQPFVSIVEFSSTKKRRQEELLKENDDQRSFIIELKGKNRALEDELMNLKHSIMDPMVDENFDSRYLNKIYMLEKKVNKSEDLLDEKNREIVSLKRENEKLQDSIDENLVSIKNFESQVRKMQEISKKTKNLSALEEKLKTYEKKLQEAYQDKDLLMIEVNNQRRNSKNIKIIEDQLSSEIEENSVLMRKLSEMTKKFADLSKAHNDSLIEKKLLEDSLFLADNQSVVSLVSNPSQIPSLELEELQEKTLSLEREVSRLKIENKELSCQLDSQLQLKSFGTNSEALVLKYSRLECELLETRINSNSKIEGLNVQLNDYKNKLLQANHASDLIFGENLDLKEKNSILEKQNKENTQIVTKLRQENLKLRENIDRLKVNLELDAVKKENSELRKEISKLKSDISENFQSNLSLRAENKYLYEQLESFKIEAIIVNQTSSEIVKADCLPLSEIIKNLQQMIDKDDLKIKLVDYIFELKKNNQVVSVESQQMIDKLIQEKNSFSLQVQEETRRRFEAERKSLTFLKQLRHYEDLGKES